LSATTVGAFPHGDAVIINAMDRHSDLSVPDSPEDSARLDAAATAMLAFLEGAVAGKAAEQRQEP